MDDAVNKAYAAHPTRLYLAGLDGNAVYAGGIGPFCFKPAELKAAIEEYSTAKDSEAAHQPAGQPLRTRA